MDQAADTSMSMINFQPDPDTLTKSATYDLFKSRGEPSLTYAIAELIDNSLSATKNNIAANKGRNIEVRVYWDRETPENRPNNTVIVVMDNGCGMNNEGLETWATFKLSLDKRKGNESVPLESDQVDHCSNRFLDQQISKFGAGGKEASFHIGKMVRIISKPRNDPNVYELELSEVRLRQKAEKKEDVYKEVVIHRKLADYDNRMTALEEHTTRIDNSSDSYKIKEQIVMKIMKEKEKPLLTEDNPSFTHIFISDVYAKEHGDEFEGPIQKHLADIFSHYLHGPKGNIENEEEKKREMRTQGLQSLQNLNIVLKYFDIKHKKPSEIPLYESDLKRVDTNKMTKYIRAAADCFEFKEGDTPEKKGRFQGIVYYYPYVMGRETFPGDVYSKNDDSDDDDVQIINLKQDPHPQFSIYWAGRLIPCTKIKSLKWTSKEYLKERMQRDVKDGPQQDFPPAECANRIWGIIFLNNSFNVTQNKLTVSEDIKKYIEEEAEYIVRREGDDWSKTRFAQGLNKWINDCHKKYDKEIIFTIPRGIDDYRKLKPDGQYYKYEKISLDGRDKEFQKGEEVILEIAKNHKIIGMIEFFLVKAKGRPVPQRFTGAGGYVCISREDHKSEEFIPISKMDVEGDSNKREKIKEEEKKKYPHEITLKPYDKDSDVVAVTEGCEILSDPSISIGPFEIDVLDREKKSTKGKLPNKKTFSVRILIKYYPKATQQDNHAIAKNKKANRGKQSNILPPEIIYTADATWSVEWKHFSLPKIPDHRLKRAGDYTLELSLEPAIPAERYLRQKPLIHFKVVPNIAKTPCIDTDRLSTDIQMGKPFDMPIIFTDYNEAGARVAGDELLGNLTKPLRNYRIEILRPNVTNVEFERTDVVEDTFWIRNIIVRGEMKPESDHETGFDDVEFIVKFLGNPKSTPDELDLGISCKPGDPAKVDILHDDDPEIPGIKYNETPTFGYLVTDSWGNQITKKDCPDLALNCTFGVYIGSSFRKVKGSFMVNIVDDGPLPDSRYEMLGQKAFRINMHGHERLMGTIDCTVKNHEAKGFKKIMYVNVEAPMPHVLEVRHLDPDQEVEANIQPSSPSSSRPMVMDTASQDMNEDTVTDFPDDDLRKVLDQETETITGENAEDVKMAFATSFATSSQSTSQMNNSTTIERNAPSSTRFRTDIANPISGGDMIRRSGQNLIDSTISSFHPTNSSTPAKRPRTSEIPESSRLANNTQSRPQRQPPVNEPKSSCCGLRKGTDDYVQVTFCKKCYDRNRPNFKFCHNNWLMILTLYYNFKMN